MKGASLILLVCFAFKRYILATDAKIDSEDPLHHGRNHKKKKPKPTQSPPEPPVEVKASQIPVLDPVFVCEGRFILTTFGEALGYFFRFLAGVLELQRTLSEAIHLKLSSAEINSSPRKPLVVTIEVPYIGAGEWDRNKKPEGRKVLSGRYRVGATELHLTLTQREGVDWGPSFTKRLGDCPIYQTPDGLLYPNCHSDSFISSLENRGECHHR